MESLQASLVAMKDMFSAKMTEIQQQLQQSPSSPTTKSLENEFTTFRVFMMSALDTVQQQIACLAQLADQLDMRGRRKIILLHGVPEEKDEDIADTVTSLVSEKLHIKDFTSECISRSHRLGKPTDNKTRPVLVKFKDVSMKNKVWFSKAKLKGTGVTQSEFLTKSRHATFLRARQIFGVSKCWTRDGVINVLAPDGSRHQVESLAELNVIPKAPVSSNITEPPSDSSTSATQPTPGSSTSATQPSSDDCKPTDAKGSARAKRAAKK